ncbi:MAG: outer membrane protein assembly factor BamE [Nevskiales bacterium]|nr:outer membrane protein assembly factor BamE [Nevskiales bacterium]
MHVTRLVLLSLTLAGCGLVYKLPTQQGNTIEQKELDRLKLGMNREQVRFLLGTPLAANPFRPERWDYATYYKTPRGQITQRTVSLYFKNDALTRIDSSQPASIQNPDPPDFKKTSTKESSPQS